MESPETGSGTGQTPLSTAKCDADREPGSVSPNSGSHMRNTSNEEGDSDRCNAGEKLEASSEKCLELHRRGRLTTSLRIRKRSRESPPVAMESPETGSGTGQTPLSTAKCDADREPGSVSPNSGSHMRNTSDEESDSDRCNAGQKLEASSKKCLELHRRGRLTTSLRIRKRSRKWPPVAMESPETGSGTGPTPLSTAKCDVDREPGSASPNSGSHMRNTSDEESDSDRCNGGQKLKASSDKCRELLRRRRLNSSLRATKRSRESPPLAMEAPETASSTTPAPFSTQEPAAMNEPASVSWRGDERRDVRLRILGESSSPGVEASETTSWSATAPSSDPEPADGTEPGSASSPICHCLYNSQAPNPTHQRTSPTDQPQATADDEIITSPLEGAQAAPPFSMDVTAKPFCRTFPRHQMSFRVQRHFITARRLAAMARAAAAEPTNPLVNESSGRENSATPLLRQSGKLLTARGTESAPVENRSTRSSSDNGESGDWSDSTSSCYVGGAELRRAFDSSMQARDVRQRPATSQLLHLDFWCFWILAVFCVLGIILVVLKKEAQQDVQYIREMLNAASSKQTNRSPDKRRR
ncbi:uncharacterized protein LOC144135223 [Amblyomma americanum]